jgi:hypothetical protein
MPGGPSYVGHVVYVGTLYRGEGPWGVWLAFWQTLWPWSARPWSYATSYAAGLLTERRRGRTEVVTNGHRTGRARRQYLRRGRQAREREARERGRRWRATVRELGGG